MPGVWSIPFVPRDKLGRYLIFELPEGRNGSKFHQSQGNRISPRPTMAQEAVSGSALIPVYSSTISAQSVSMLPGAWSKTRNTIPSTVVLCGYFPCGTFFARDLVLVPSSTGLEFSFSADGGSESGRPAQLSTRERGASSLGLSLLHTARPSPADITAD